MDSQILDKIFESMGLTEKLQSSEVKDQVSAILEEIVNHRVQALTLEHEAKEKALLEKAEKAAADLKNKEDILAEEAHNFIRELKEEMNAKESIMCEEVKAYAENIETIIAEEAKLFREHVEKIAFEEAFAHKSQVESILLEELENYKQFLEGTVTEEATAFIKKQEQDLAQEVYEFKESMVNKVGEYFEAELPKRIPKNIMESAVKLSAYEPLIEGVVNLFSKNYVKLDSQSFDIIKEAKAENEKLSESINAKLKDTVHLQAQVSELQKKLKITELVEGMTITQKGKAVPLLESCSTVEEVAKKFNNIKDIVISETAAKKVEKAVKAPITLSESAQKKLETLKAIPVSKNVSPEMAEWQTRLNDQLTKG